MSAAQDVPLPWTWGYSVADMDVIARMDDETRASVERYVRDRAFGLTFEHRTAKEAERTEGEEEAYAEGFRDGVEEAADAASSTYYHRRRKVAR